MRLIFCTLILLIFCACSNPYPDYKSLGDSTYEKYLKFGDPSDLQLCQSHHTLISYKLGLHREEANGFDYWNDYSFQNIQKDALGESKLGEALCHLKLGDQKKFLFPYSHFKDSYLNEYELDSVKIADTTMMFLDIEILELYDQSTYQAKLDEKYKEGVLEENEFLREYLETKNLIDSCKFYEDVYWMKLDSTDGIQLQSGMEIELEYRGYFLDGKEFDNTHLDSTALYFQYGKPGQVIRGIELAISKMREGEKTRAFIPSHKAFGVKGSTTGIVKANTPICFDILLKNIYTAEELDSLSRIKVDVLK